MYFNDVFIGWYIGATIIGLIIGKFVAWCNERLPRKEKIFTKEFFEKNRNGIKFNYIFMILIAISYIFLIYHYGINKDDFFSNLDLLKLLVLVPMLVLVISIDAIHRIIPNRLTLTIFETGLIISFLYGITNVNMVKEYILGMLIGGGIFLIITALGTLIAGKEALGLGDVKLMAGLGLYFGMDTIIEITLATFFIAAFIAIFTILIRNIIMKKNDEYIALGPSISIASFLCMVLPSGYILELFMNLCNYLVSII